MDPKVKIALVIGTRPEAIKMAPVYLTMKADPWIDPCLIVSAQHREMLDDALTIFDIAPDIDLDLMEPGQTLSDLAARLIVNVQSVLKDIKPDIVLVHGDTSTCLFSAMAAFYEQIPIGHVEAGLRTYNYLAPWPEEMNRRLTDQISDWCFAPTPKAAENLHGENIPTSNIYITGNTGIDAFLLALQKIENRPMEVNGLDPREIEGKRLILVTGHRRESFGRPFEQFCLALKDIAEVHSDIVIVYPVHLNPNVQKPVKRILDNEKRIVLIDPIAYLPFVQLMKRCEFIITDSGGIQEEAPSIHKPVLITRSTTERPEAMDAGMAQLVGTSRNEIVAAASQLLTDPERYRSMYAGVNPYGDGKASKRIVEILTSQNSKRDGGLNLHDEQEDKSSRQ